MCLVWCRRRLMVKAVKNQQHRRCPYRRTECGWMFAMLHLGGTTGTG